jgi:hypothetical protein
MDTMGKLLVDTYCSACGFVKGLPAGENHNRCTECGRFTSDNPDVCCTKHEVRESPYSSGTCPMCEQERHVRAQEREMMERRSDPNMHPTVDQKRR